jgi:hypothetical protein
MISVLRNTWEHVFLIIDILPAISDKTVLKISVDFIVRDHIHPLDFFKMVNAIPAFLRTLGRSCAGMLWPVTFKAPIARNLSADGRFVLIKKLGDFSLILSGFHKGLDLIFLHLGGDFCSSWATSTGRPKSLER